MLVHGLFNMNATDILSQNVTRGIILRFLSHDMNIVLHSSFFSYRVIAVVLVKMLSYIIIKNRSAMLLITTGHAVSIESSFTKLFEQYLVPVLHPFFHIRITNLVS